MMNRKRQEAHQSDDPRSRAIHTLYANGAMTASSLGSMLWGTRYRQPQAYARPAGKILHALKRDGAVEWYNEGRLTMWRLTDRGRLKLLLEKDTAKDEQNRQKMNKSRER